MKKQIGVIFGSRSCEREVSIISAVQLNPFGVQPPIFNASLGLM